MSQRLPSGTPVFAIGEQGLTDALKDAKFKVLPIEKAEKAEAVVIGIDKMVNFEKMCAATLLVRAGKPFFATNPDKTFPTPRGQIPGAGAWFSVITTATDVQPIIAGKPLPYLLELSLERLGTPKENTYVVGDRLETDIAGGQALGAPTVLVLSGVSTLAAAQAWTPKIDIIAENLSTLVGA
jgi:4-nitrophenyl phosphatase